MFGVSARFRGLWFLDWVAVLLYFDIGLDPKDALRRAQPVYFLLKTVALLLQLVGGSPLTCHVCLFVCCFLACLFAVLFVCECVRRRQLW